MNLYKILCFVGLHSRIIYEESKDFGITLTVNDVWKSLENKKRTWECLDCGVVGEECFYR